MDHRGGVGLRRPASSSCTGPTRRPHGCGAVEDRRRWSTGGRAASRCSTCSARWSFRGLDLLVDPRVLIPRPETETTAELAIEEVLRSRRRGAGPTDPWAGAATGVRGRRPRHRHRRARTRARGGAARRRGVGHRRQRGRPRGRPGEPRRRGAARRRACGSRTASWFEALPEELRGTPAARRVEPAVRVRGGVLRRCRPSCHREPVGALVSGPTGLEAIEAIVAEAPGWLEPDGVLVLELAPHQAERAGGARARCLGSRRPSCATT